MLLCAAMWSIGGIFIKLIPFGPMPIVGMRSLISALTMLIYMKCGGFKFVFTRRALRSGIYLCCLFVLFVAANKLTTAANAIVLQFASPMFVLLISAVFKKQRFSRADVIAVIITMAGITLFFFDKSIRVTSSAISSLCLRWCSWRSYSYPAEKRSITRK